MTKYKKYVSIGGKNPIWVVAEDGKIINENPTKDELKDLEVEPHKIKRRKRYTKKHILGLIVRFYEKNGRVPKDNDFRYSSELPDPSTIQIYFRNLNNAIRDAGLWEKRYNQTHSCDRCGGNFGELERLGRTPLKEYDEKRDWTGNWDCYNCYEKYDPNSQRNVKKSLADHRTGNLNPNSSQEKGDKGEYLLCKWKGFKNLNEEHDNYSFPIDCIDEKTGLYYQVKIAYYNPKKRCWSQNFKNLHNSIIRGFRFKSLFIFCVSEDGKRIERIYEISEKEVICRTGVAIVKNPSRGVQWYEQYRLEDKDELEKVNDIWCIILDRKRGIKKGESTNAKRKDSET